MNILFLIFGFVSVFILFSSMLMKQTIYFSSVEKSSTQLLKAEHALLDKWERYKYKTYERQIEKIPYIKRNSSKKKEYLSHRCLSNLPLQAKWNLAPLLLADQLSDSLLEANANFLERIYGHAPFWKKAKEQDPHLPYTLISSWQKKRTQKNLITKIGGLFPEEASLQGVFYKMLKGSGYYVLSTQEGYPPLDDFFRFSKEDPSIVCLPYASHIALESLLGKKLTEAIMEIEEAKFVSKGGYYSVTLSELLTLATTHTPKISIQEMQTLLQQTHKKSKLEKLTYREKKTVTEFPLP